MSRLLLLLSVSHGSCGQVISTAGQVCHQHRMGQQLYHLGQTNGFNGVVRNERGRNPEEQTCPICERKVLNVRSCTSLTVNSKEACRVMQNQVPMIQPWLIVTHLVEQARRDKYHRLESLSQRGEAEADGALFFLSSYCCS